jgi:hypothetical protein
MSGKAKEDLGKMLSSTVVEELRLQMLEEKIANLEDVVQELCEMIDTDTEEDPIEVVVLQKLPETAPKKTSVTPRKRSSR